MLGGENCVIRAIARNHFAKWVQEKDHDDHECEINEEYFNSLSERSSGKTGMTNVVKIYQCKKNNGVIMELSGSRFIAADIDTVWSHLNNPETLRLCIPGCEDLTGSPDIGFAATVKQKVGPVSATFKGEVTLENVIPGKSYTIVGEGKGGVAGFAKGSADVLLETVDGGTNLTYTATAKVGGKLAQLGSRIIGGFAKKMADQFFERFQNTVEASTAPID